MDKEMKIGTEEVEAMFAEIVKRRFRGKTGGLTIEEIKAAVNGRKRWNTQTKKV